MEKDCSDIRSYRIRANEEKHLILPEQPYYIILVVESTQILPEWRNWICDCLFQTLYSSDGYRI
ncbi:hypothetical protein MWMV14_MWMV14_00397 [Acinetobacter baumannii]|nr:hypothetical protein MWMV9_MWMV9_00392 [Acinetobacter baumannii]CAI3106141.1 hypothetical protein MWMV11_MWMV11_00395 [Acinetobacter baumannii]CAI3106146.1 hypothetical protein MWMV14_MWMV14_00397 [Acinetobacter baumannii]